MIERGAGADDVDDGVLRPDFVKVDFLDRRAMHLRLGFTKPAKDPLGFVGPTDEVRIGRDGVVHI